MEGCSKYCTFCVVPLHARRGGLAAVRRRADRHRRSRRPGRARSHAAGQNVNAYAGKLADAPATADFATLLEHVAEIPGIERIRYTTSHPVEMSPRLIELYARLRSSCRSFTCRCSPAPTACWRR
jgi:tRNA-2-methylthio-N6-dimethylallyladenosine synthase